MSEMPGSGQREEKMKEIAVAAENDKTRCSRCGRSVDNKRIFTVDGEAWCSTCLYGNREPFEIYPIGFVRKEATPDGPPGRRAAPGDSARIELFPSQERFLYGVKDEKHLTVVYHLHASGPVKSVFNRGLDGKKAGVFATRTPHRLSRIGIQDVKLTRVEGTTLYVEGLDAIDGTPVLDIKLCWSALRK